MKKIILVISFVLLIPWLQPHTTFAAGNLIDAPFIRQMPELPRGCEVTSLAMMLQDAGVDVGKMQLAKEIKKVPFKKDGYYGNPYDGFVGNIYTFSQPGLGVYHGPIYDLANKYLPNRVVDLTGGSMQDVYNAIDKGKPVWVITNSRFSHLSDSEFKTWNTRSGKLKITYREHSVLVVGYDSKYVYINDPLYHKKNRAVNRDNFEDAWVQMGKQAITYISENEAKYNKAVEQGKQLSADLQSFNSIIDSGNIREINKAYDTFTAKIKAYGITIGQVPGSSNRNTLGNQYVKPAKIAVERVIYEVSQYRLLTEVIQQIDSGAISEAETSLAKLNRLKNRAVAIKKAGNYLALPQEIDRELMQIEADARGKLLSADLEKFNTIINSGDIKAINDAYDPFTAKIKTYGKTIGQVYGASNRDTLSNQYVKPAKEAVERVIYEVSQYRLLTEVIQQIDSGMLSEAEDSLSKLNRLKAQAIAIKEAGNYPALPVGIDKELTQLEADARDRILNENNAAYNNTSLTSISQQ